MKVVLDTNVLISAIVFGGKPRTIFEKIAIEKTLSGITSRSLFNELLSVLKVKFKYSDIQLNKVEHLIRENFFIVSPKKIPYTIKEDPFDNQVLAIVDEHPVDFIISGDNHLLKIKVYKNVPIFLPDYFLNKILTDSTTDAS